MATIIDQLPHGVIICRPDTNLIYDVDDVQNDPTIHLYDFCTQNNHLWFWDKPTELDYTKFFQYPCSSIPGLSLSGTRALFVNDHESVAIYYEPHSLLPGHFRKFLPWLTENKFYICAEIHCDYEQTEFWLEV